MITIAYHTSGVEGRLNQFFQVGQGSLDGRRESGGERDRVRVWGTVGICCQEWQREVLQIIYVASV